MTSCAPEIASFLSLTSAATHHPGIPGAWHGSVYRYHPCGFLRGPLLLINHWDGRSGEARVLTEPEAGIAEPVRQPASWICTDMALPRPLAGEQLTFYRDGRWVSGGPWCGALVRLLAELDVEVQSARHAAGLENDARQAAARAKEAARAAEAMRQWPGGTRP